MSDAPLPLSDILDGAARGRGVASLAVIERAGAAPRVHWTPASRDEPAFLAYSITKTFIAVVLLALRDDRRLDLDDRLARWLPGVPGAERISLRQLLTHTAGIPDYGGRAVYHDAVRASPSSPWTFDRFAAETFERGLDFEPGTGWRYSNPGYMLLKRVTEEVAGASLRALVAERIARPLGLGRTFVAESLEDLAALAPGTSTELSPDGAPLDVRAHYHPGWVSHGVVAATASDVARFLDALFAGALLPAGSLAEMTTLVAVPAHPDMRHRRPSYGLGLMADPASRWGTIAGHNGGGPCYSASAFHAFDLGGASVCAMGALEGFDAEAVLFAVLDRLGARTR